MTAVILCQIFIPHWASSAGFFGSPKPKRGMASLVCPKMTAVRLYALDGKDDRGRTVTEEDIGKWNQNDYNAGFLSRGGWEFALDLSPGSHELTIGYLRKSSEPKGGRKVLFGLARQGDTHYEITTNRSSVPLRVGFEAEAGKIYTINAEFTEENWKPDVREITLEDLSDIWNRPTLCGGLKEESVDKANARLQKYGAGLKKNAEADEGTANGWINMLKSMCWGMAGARTMAAKELGKFDLPISVSALIEALDDPTPKVRAAAAKSLGKLGSQQAKDPLQRLLQDPEESVRKEAQTAISKIGDSPAERAGSVAEEVQASGVEVRARHKTANPTATVALDNTEDGDYDAAIRNIETATSEKGDSASFFLLGWAYYQRGFKSGDPDTANKEDAQKTVAAYLKALSLDPKLSKVAKPYRLYHSLAMSYEALGTYDKALDAYRLAIRAAPVNPIMPLYAARLRYRMGDLPKSAANLTLSLKKAKEAGQDKEIVKFLRANAIFSPMLSTAENQRILIDFEGGFRSTPKISR